jgi:homoserine dehydrogenase
VSQEKGYDIKLVASAKKMNDGKVAAFVLPQFVAKTDYLSSVKNEFNGVVIESGFADQQLFLGKGAGSFPTATAVLGDISALRYDYKYEYKKLYDHVPSVLTNDFYLRVYVSFNHLSQVKLQSFACIEEWHGGTERSYLVGIIRFDELYQNRWWKSDGVSLIVRPDGVLENVDFNSIKTTKLEFPLVQ